MQKYVHMYIRTYVDMVGGNKKLPFCNHSYGRVTIILQYKVA